jgi:hypothetical protein
MKFVTTEKFNPAGRPNGSMVKSLYPYHIDWLTASTTLCSEMTCPECLAQLAPSGVLNVMVPIKDVGEAYRALFPEDYLLTADEVDEHLYPKVPRTISIGSDGELVFDLDPVLNDLENIPLKSFPPGEDRIATPIEISKSIQKRLDAQGALTCSICNDGRVFKSKIALNGHMKKHEKGK